jgi:hypothetical protein
LYQALKRRLSAYIFPKEKLEGKRLLKRPSRRRENDIKMNLKETGCGLALNGVQWRTVLNTVLTILLLTIRVCIGLLAKKRKMPLKNLQAVS